MTAHELLEYSRLRQLEEPEFLNVWRDAVRADHKNHLMIVELAAAVRYLSFAEALLRYAARFPDEPYLPSHGGEPGRTPV